MSYSGKIECNPDILLGKPVIKGTRISVELILRKLSEGASIDDLMSSYPGVQKTDIFAWLEYGADVISSEELIEA